MKGSTFWILPGVWEAILSSTMGCKVLQVTPHPEPQSKAKIQEVQPHERRVKFAKKM